MELNFLDRIKEFGQTAQDSIQRRIDEGVNNVNNYLENNLVDDALKYVTPPGAMPVQDQNISVPQQISASIKDNSKTIIIAAVAVLGVLIFLKRGK